VLRLRPVGNSYVGRGKRHCGVQEQSRDHLDRTAFSGSWMVQSVDESRSVDTERNGTVNGRTILLQASSTASERNSSCKQNLPGGGNEAVAADSGRKLIQNVGLGHFDISDLVALKAVYLAAREVNVPVLVGVSEGERDFIGVHQIAALVRSIREQNGFPLYLSADHTHSNREGS
jgi:Fructose-bisphosphate aldolase class-II